MIDRSHTTVLNGYRVRVHLVETEGAATFFVDIDDTYPNKPRVEPESLTTTLKKVYDPAETV